jgi:hypothetical protein
MQVRFCVLQSKSSTILGRYNRQKVVRFFEGIVLPPKSSTTENRLKVA